eukprot:6506833-Prymnesium_polylepis.1
MLSRGSASTLLRLSLVALAARGTRGHDLRVYHPPEVAGRYEVAHYPFSPPEYRINSELAVAASCPCGWLEAGRAAPNSSDGLTGRVLLLSSGICSGGCLPFSVACAAALENASGVIVSRRYNEDAFRVMVAQVVGGGALTEEVLEGEGDGDGDGKQQLTPLNLSTFWLQDEYYSARRRSV